MSTIRIINQHYKDDEIQFMTQQNGFTLVELMVVIVIIAILAAIAIPGYRHYAIKNAEDEAKAQMQQVELQLERWRASALSYKNFRPKIGVDSDGNPEYGYVDTDNTQINVPLGSTTPRYVITLVDGTSPSDSLVQPSAGSTTTVSPSTARSWKMLAVPNATGSIGNDGHAFIMTSTGNRCQKSIGGLVTASITDSCGDADWEAW